VVTYPRLHHTPSAAAPCPWLPMTRTPSSMARASGKRPAEMHVLATSTHACARCIRSSLAQWPAMSAHTASAAAARSAQPHLPERVACLGGTISKKKA
jgi:hypothetical protein